jgi:nitrate reductase beta subunit
MTYKWEAIAQDLTEENERLRKALERLGSMKAFEGSRTVHDIVDAELMARIQFARAALEQALNELVMTKEG